MVLPLELVWHYFRAVFCPLYSPRLRSVYTVTLNCALAEAERRDGCYSASESFLRVPRSCCEAIDVGDACLGSETAEGNVVGYSSERERGGTVCSPIFWRDGGVSPLGILAPFPSDLGGYILRQAISRSCLVFVRSLGARVIMGLVAAAGAAGRGPIQRWYRAVAFDSRSSFGCTRDALGICIILIITALLRILCLVFLGWLRSCAVCASMRAEGASGGGAGIKVSRIWRLFLVFYLCREDYR